MARIRRMRGRSLIVIGAAVIALMSLGGSMVFATHDFSDVPVAAFYHDEVSYIVDRDITAGCGGTKYCPNSAVTRGSMAVFLQKTSAVSSPKFLQDTEGAGTVDLDTPETMCITGSHTPTYPQVARVDSWVTLEGAGALSFAVRNQYSTNGGTTWNNLDATAVGRGGVAATDHWGQANNIAILNLAAGTTYIFSVEVDREGPGTADATDSRCEVVVQIDNRNA